MCLLASITIFYLPCFNDSNHGKPKSPLCEKSQIYESLDIFRLHSTFLFGTMGAMGNIVGFFLGWVFPVVWSRVVPCFMWNVPKKQTTSFPKHDKHERLFSWNKEGVYSCKIKFILASCFPTVVFFHALVSGRSMQLSFWKGKSVN